MLADNFWASCCLPGSSSPAVRIAHCPWGPALEFSISGGRYGSLLLSIISLPQKYCCGDVSSTAPWKTIGKSKTLPSQEEWKFNLSATSASWRGIDITYFYVPRASCWWFCMTNPDLLLEFSRHPNRESQSNKYPNESETEITPPSPGQTQRWAASQPFQGDECHGTTLVVNLI